MKTRTDYVPVNTDTIDTDAILADTARWASLVGRADTQILPPGGVFAKNSTGQTWFANIGEQTSYKDPNVYFQHWRCVSTGSSGDYNPNGRWQTLHTAALGPIPGGVLIGEWSGIAYSAQFTPQSHDNTYPPCPHYVRVRITVAGQVQVYRVLTHGIRTARFPFSFVVPPGDTSLLIEWTTSPNGTDDPTHHTVLGTSYPLPEAHIGPSKLFVELVCR